MTDETDRVQRFRQSFRESRELLKAAPPPYIPRDEPLHYAVHDPGPREPEPEEYRPRLDTAPAPPRVEFSAHYIETRIDQRIEQERDFLKSVLAEYVTDALNEMTAEYQKVLNAERAQHERELQALQKQINELAILVSRAVHADEVQRQQKRTLELAAMPVHGDNMN